MNPELLHASAVTALIFGGAIAVLNFHLSFIRHHILRLCGWEPRFVSGVPLIGSLLLVPAAVWFGVEGHPWLLLASLLAFLVDTGGAAWFLPGVIREYRRSE